MSTKARLRKMFESKSRKEFDRQFAGTTISHWYTGSALEVRTLMWDAWQAGAAWQKRQRKRGDASCNAFTR